MPTRGRASQVAIYLKTELFTREQFAARLKSECPDSANNVSKLARKSQDPNYIASVKKV